VAEKPSTLPTYLTRTPVFLLIRAAEKAARLGEQISHRHLGLALREVWVLLTAGHFNMNQGDVADFLGINRNTMVSIVDGLEKRRLIQRRKNPDNRKEYILSLTEKGGNCVTQWNNKYKEMLTEATEPLSYEETQQLFKLLNKYIG
jgi:DNA-binding MarR family transcriptional regulator